MNLRRSFDDFNPSRFFVFATLFLFIVLFCMRYDNYINWSYWVVFLPLWIWKMVVFFGFIVGCVVWCRHPQYRVDSHIQFKAMILSTICQMMLFLFEVLVCYKLEADVNKWVFIFIPLLVLSLSGIAICIWALKNGRSFELELVCAVNILFFVFLALRLDKLIHWDWSIVFIPMWIVMSIVIVMELYGLILAIILCKSPELMPEQRRHTLSVTLGYAFVVFPILLFEILLVQRMDNKISVPYIVVSLPLLAALVVLILMVFKIRAGSGNPWWFGVRKNICQLLLETCPLLQEYANISYKMRSMHPAASRQPTRGQNERTNTNARSALELEASSSGDAEIPIVVTHSRPGGALRFGNKGDIDDVIKKQSPTSSCSPVHTLVVDMPD